MPVSRRQELYQVLQATGLQRAILVGCSLIGETILDVALEQGYLVHESELQMRIWVDGPFRQPEQVDPLFRWRAAEINRTALAKSAWGLTQAPVPDLLDPPAAQRLDGIQAPALIIAGELDHPEILRPASVMESTIPGSQKAAVACRAALRWGKTLRPGKPEALRLQGRYARLKGSASQARYWWGRSLAEAEALGMPHELGLTHLEIGRRLGEDAPQERRLWLSAHVTGGRAVHDLPGRRGGHLARDGVDLLKEFACLPKQAETLPGMR
jgi:hypothetical protein